MEQQLLSLAQARRKYIIAVLPQGSNRSRFGDLSTQSGAYLKEVFARLIADGHLPNGTYPGNGTISGTAAAAWLRAPRSRSAGHMADARICCFSTRLILNVSRKFQEERKRERQFNADGSPKMTCKRCASNEYGRVSKWVTDRIKYDAKIEVSQKSLKEFGTKFRGFTHAPVDPKESTCARDPIGS